MEIALSSLHGRAQKNTFEEGHFVVNSKNETIVTILYNLVQKMKIIVRLTVTELLTLINHKLII